MKRKILILAILAFCFSAPARAGAVKVAVTRAELSGLFFIAYEKGFFGKEGVEVELDYYPTSHDGFAPLRSGRADMWVGSDVTYVSALAQSPDLTVVSSVATWDNEFKVIARRDSGIKRPSDLRGKRLGVQKGNSIQYFMDLMLMREGFGEKDAFMVFRNAPDLPGLISDNKLDAICAREPFYGYTLDFLSGNAVVFEMPGIYRRNYVLTARKCFVNANYRQITRMLSALKRAEKYIHENPSDCAGIVIKTVGTNSEKLTEYWKEIDFDLSIDKQLVMELEEISHWLIRTGQLTSMEIPNFLNHIDERPLKEVSSDAVRLIK